MPELPTCACVRGLPPYDRLTAIYQAAANLSGDTSLPDATCVAAVPPFQRFAYIYAAFRILADDGDLPLQGCIASESLSDQVSAIYRAVYLYADDATLLSYECVRGLPLWQQWVEIYRALYLAAGSPEELLPPLCVAPTFDVLSDVYCATIFLEDSVVVLLASLDITEESNINTFTRSGAAGYTALGEIPFQREVGTNVLRGSHYIGSVPTVILETAATPCDPAAPSISVTPTDLNFSGTITPAAADWLFFKWRLDGVGSYTNLANGVTSISSSAAAGNHVLNAVAVTAGGAVGVVGTSPSFTLSSPFSFVDNFNRADGPLGSGWAAGGTGWNDLAISSHTCVFTSGNSLQKVASPTYPDNQIVYGTVGALSNGKLVLSLRVSPAGECYLFWINSPTVVTLQKCSSGFSFSQVTANSSFGTIVPGDVISFEVDSAFNFIAKQNGVSILTYTDGGASYQSGQPGLGVIGASDFWTSFTADQS